MSSSDETKKDRNSDCEEIDYVLINADVNHNLVTETLT